ncbi:MAG: FtsW/RodA/SpoVE family cell cycle protein [Oscillospiraceae bacterium]
MIKTVLKIIWQYFKKLDKQLFIAVSACSLFSVLLVYSIVKNGMISYLTTNEYKKQLVAVGLGMIAAMVLSALDYRKFVKLWFLYGPACMILSLLLFTPLGFGREGSNNVNWLDLGFISIQPSEFLKLAFILTFALHLSKVDDKINQPIQLLLLLLHAALPIGVIFIQNDYGTVAVFIFIVAIMLYSAGISFKYIAAVLVALPALAAAAWFFVLGPTHKNRILVLFNPNLDTTAGDQQAAGKIALGSGQLFGKGLFGGEYYYVPDAHNDFILSYIGQTLGFVGCMITIGVLGYICLKILANAHIARDNLGKYICMGVFALMLIHCFINIGMVLGVMPVIGVPLPFISDGGTAMLSMYVAIGFVMSTYSHSDKGYAVFYDKT